MPLLISELKKDHHLIINTLEQMLSLGIRSKEGQQKLLDLRKTLLAHLRKEDERLYPVLEKAALADPNLKSTLELFAKDMAEISEDARVFFERYRHGEQTMEFVKDFGRLYAMLTTRIRKEENILYAEYERVKKQE